MSSVSLSEPTVPLWLRIDEFIAGASLVVTVLSVVWGVITRYLFPQPAAWAYEVAVIAFAWCVFFGASACVFVVLFPKSWQRAIDIFNWFLLAAFFALLAALFAMQAVLTMHVLTIALSLPRSVIYGPLALACLMMFGHHVALWGSWNRPHPAAAIETE